MKQALIKFVSFVFISVLAHWALVNIYVYFCAPPTIFGIFKSVLNIGSPVCQFINKLQYEIAKNYVTIWIAAGTATVTFILSKLK